MIVIMQARVGSTRLPGKAFFTFCGQNMIERAISIAQSIKGVDKVILATGDRAENLSLRSYVEVAGAEFFVGSEDNVLERFCLAMDGYEGEYCLRMTCDNYLIQPEVVEGLYKAVKASNADYGYIAPLSHFSGEIVRCEALRKCYEGKYSEEAREHVTWDIRNDSLNSIYTADSNFLNLDHSCKITLDTLQDLLVMKRIEIEYPETQNTRCIEAVKKIQEMISNN